MGTLPFEQEREIFVKREVATSEKYGRRPEERSTEELLSFGVIDVNKPKGPTSHMVAEYVKRLVGAQAGHGGSLDPGVTGVLPVGIGRGTRVMQALLSAGKEYVCIMRLHDDVDEETLQRVIDKFRGRITQLPPVKSAVKRQMREREIYYFEVLEIDGRDVLFRMGCQAGTYVRKVCHDIGRELGVGAHMAELLRTKAGPFIDDNWVTLQELEDAVAFWKNDDNDKFLRHCVKPAEFGVSHLPKVWVQDNAVDTVCHGASLKVPGVAKLEAFKKGELVAVMSLKDELIALGDATMSAVQVMQEDAGICVKTSRVFMERGVYPQIGK